MTEDNDGRYNLSRRKALAGIGTIGAAVGLGGLGTYAQFTDTEENAFTFTAGGVDGTIEYAASYLNEEVRPMGGSFSPFTGDGPNWQEHSEGVGVGLHFSDVKPGDYGSILFGITVQNNEAWATNCLGLLQDSDGQSFEPEEEIEDPSGSGYQQRDDLDNYVENYSPPTSAQNADPQTSDADVYGLEGIGELAENFQLLPFYDNDNSSNFFDGGVHGYGAPTAVYSNDFFDNMNTASDETFYRPLTPRGLQGNTVSQGTVQWAQDNPASWEVSPVPEGTMADEACIVLDGSLTSGSTDDNSTESAPLAPGDTLYFGYDWHLPFGVGNEAQGDVLELGLGFVFSQTRHSQGPLAQNIYAPEDNS